MNPAPETKAATQDFWRSVEGIVVINLDERPDRWEATLREFAAFPDAPKPVRLSAVRGVDLPGFGVPPWFRGRKSDRRWAAQAGCSQSHRKALLLARQQGWKCFLVLEDDACLQPLAAIQAAQLHKALFEQFPDWQVCYLGYTKPIGTSLVLGKVGEHTLSQITGCSAAHAYLVREEARDRILSQLPEDPDAWRWAARHKTIDKWYSRHLSRALRVFALMPSAVTQREDFSDIVQRQINYMEIFDESRLRLTHSRVLFETSRRLWRARFILSDAYGAVRAVRRRLNGF